MDGAALVKQVLSGAYGVTATEARRLRAGMDTVNVVATTAGGGRLFVKMYRPGTDLSAAEAAIEVTCYARAAGVPAAVPLRDTSGALIHAGPGASLSVWTFVDGETGDAVALNAARMSSLGGVVGDLHRCLAGYRRPYGLREEWCSPDRARAAIAVTASRVQSASYLDAGTRAWARGILEWRLSRLPRVREIMAGLPRPLCQAVHGDLNPANVIFRGERPAALIDFGPPVVRPVWWEIARFACSPPAILHDELWIERLACFLRAYRERGTRLPDSALLLVPSVARCMMTASVTPFDDLVGGRGASAVPGDPLSVPSLTRYAAARHETALRLWEGAGEDEHALGKLLA